MNSRAEFHGMNKKRGGVDSPTLKGPEGENHNAERSGGRSSMDPDQLVDLHADTLYRFALLRTGDPGTAEEMVQETFLAALRAKEKFKLPDDAKARIKQRLRQKQK